MPHILIPNTFLIFQSQAPFNSVPAISALMPSDWDELARINNVTRLAVFPTNKEVTVPVNCSCMGRCHGAMTTFHPRSTDDGDNFFGVANGTFQGLASCASLKRESLKDTDKELRVPLRCACTTRNQSLSGIRYFCSLTRSTRTIRSKAPVTDSLLPSGVYWKQMGFLITTPQSSHSRPYSSL